MAEIWYCDVCGYEVYKSGKCHNCKQPLLLSPVSELAIDEVDDEVGYSLEEWEDGARGELIGELATREIRHRFEGDELVVAATDEDAVDALIAELSEEEEDDEPPAAVAGKPDDASVAVLARLYDAARRLRSDPTDMVADGDLAEAAGRMFAIDQVPGVDPDEWAAMGRVTRRLLGALGAEEALEGEIKESAEVLCRLIEELDLSDRHPGPASPDEADASYAGLTVPADADVDAGAIEPVLGPGVAVLSPSGPADDDEMVFELDDWMPEERAQVGVLLDRNQVTHEWEGTDLIVPATDDERVEALLGEVNRSTSTEPPPSEEGDDEAQYHVLSNLFGAADKLAGDAEDKTKRSDASDAAKAIADWPTPFAMSDNDWWKIRLKAKALTDSIDLDASAGTVADHAVELSDLLRNFL